MTRRVGGPISFWSVVYTLLAKEMLPQIVIWTDHKLRGHPADRVQRVMILGYVCLDCGAHIGHLSDEEYKEKGNGERTID